MRHSHAFRKFNRTYKQRRALFRSLATELLKNERIKTTLPKAKELRGIVEPLITRAAVDNLANRKIMHGYIFDKAVIQKLFAEIAPRYKTRGGGYTRILKIAELRKNDAAEMAYIELVDSPVVEEKMKAKADKNSEAPKAEKAEKKAAKKAAAPKKEKSSEEKPAKKKTAKAKSEKSA
jgi:large subunit ribosomal protein L17